MIKLLADGTLEAATVHLPTHCGEIKAELSVEGDNGGVDYYLDFLCPKNLKYKSAKMSAAANGRYEVAVPTKISENSGAVFVQAVMIDVPSGKFKSRSLISIEPIFVMHESIMADETETDETQKNFFEYAAGVASACGDKLEELNGFAGEIALKCDAAIREAADGFDELKVAENAAFNELKSEQTASFNALKQSQETLFDSKISAVDEKLKSVDNKLATADTKISSVDDKIAEIESRAASGSFDGRGFVYRGAWQSGATYYAGGNSKEISVVTVQSNGAVWSYVCKVGGTASQSNKPDSASWEKIAGADKVDLSAYQQTTSNSLNTANKNLVSAINELNTKKAEKTEVIYDKNSSNTTLNWGFPSGIYGGAKITNKNFSPYKYLLVYWQSSHHEICIAVNVNSPMGGATILAHETSADVLITASFAVTSASFEVFKAGYYASVTNSGFSNFQDRNGGAYVNEYRVYKIEGVLK